MLAGSYMALVPVMFTTVTAASANAYTVGPVIGVLALAALAFPRARWIEWTQLLAAAWLFLAPWAPGFSGVSGAALERLGHRSAGGGARGDADLPVGIRHRPAGR